MSRASRAPPLGPKMVWMVGLNAVALVSLVLLVRAAWQVITWILVALFLALALEPLVSWLQRRGLRRGLAVVSVYLAFVGLLVVLLRSVVPLSLHQARLLVDEAPVLFGELRRTSVFSWLDEHLGVGELLHEGLRQGSGSSLRPMVELARRMFIGVGAAVAVSYLSLFMLLFGRDVVDSLLGWFEPDRRERLLGLAQQMSRRVGGYVGGALLLALVEGAGVGLVLLAVGVPYFLPLALLVALLAIVPLLGSVLSAVLLAVTTLVSAGLHAALVVLGVYLLYAQVDAHVLRPLVQRHTIQMNPLLITVVVLLGAGVAGLLGALLALPVAAAVQVVLQDVRARREAQWRVRLAGSLEHSQVRDDATRFPERSVMAITDSNLGSITPRPRTTASLWGGPFVMGLLLTLLGVVALGAVVLTSLVSVIFYGSMLVVAGAFEIVHAFRIRKKGEKGGPFVMFLLGGVLSIGVGLMLLARPDAGLLALTLLMAGYFFASGLFRGITSVADRYEGWGWDLAYGIVSVALGAIIFAQFPSSSMWALGIVVGVEILSRGISIMAGALAVRGVLRRQVHA
ncbi:AI-2E family transporter [Archangium lansingense]|uniref:AI-2E family transporter n=1 Tax=Archangium lansingense TaxID=2995310 RepID=UPI003B7C041F